MNHPNTPDQDDDLLDEREAAKFLGLKHGTLQVWRSTKRYALDYVKIGRNVRYRRSTLLAFIEARTQSGAAIIPDIPDHGSWIKASDRRPEPKQRIVCEFANGSLWAGEYQGKKQSFVRWIALPE